MKRIALTLIFCVASGFGWAVSIDSFTTDQSNSTEIDAAEALGGVRAISAVIGTAAVTGGSFTCDGSGAIGVCTVVYDGTNDGVGNINAGIMNVDLSTGESEISLMVDSLTGGQPVSFNIEARDINGVLCQLSGSAPATGALVIPFVPSANGADCVAVLATLKGMSIQVGVTNGVVAFSMLESTPVDLQSFSVE